tara:strand:- start:3937 stop:4185 length:249 start_codon:yes stop_codon:yes gene_type:complete
MVLTDLEKKQNNRNAYVKWRTNNRDTVNECVRKYRRNNRDKEQASNRKSSLLYYAKSKGYSCLEDFERDKIIKDVRKLFQYC